MTQQHASPRDLVDLHGILPRDCRLLQTSSAHLATRDRYFIFRFPPFAGAVKHDHAILINNDSDAACEALQQQLTHAGSHELPFEHRVLEAVLREESRHKWDRYARLAQLIRAGTAPEDPSSWGLTWLLNTSREAKLYRLITLSKALSTLAIDVKRSQSAISALLASDEDMSMTYLTYRDQKGSERAIDDHTDVELLLENFATEHEDLADRIEALQDGVTTLRALEQLWLSNERNRIMRLELVIAFSTASLALTASVAGFFGMNLHSGIEEVPGLFWAVTGVTATAAASVFAAFVLSVRRFHSSQQQLVARTASLDRSLTGLDSAYFALRQRSLMLDDRQVAEGDDDGSGGRAEPLVITKEILREALQRAASSNADADVQTMVAPRHGDVDELWRLLDADGDGVLTASELTGAGDPHGDPNGDPQEVTSRSKDRMTSE